MCYLQEGEQRQHDELQTATGQDAQAEIWKRTFKLTFSACFIQVYDIMMPPAFGLYKSFNLPLKHLSHHNCQGKTFFTLAPERTVKID